jgi:hypothetical protein
MSCVFGGGLRRTTRHCMQRLVFWMPATFWQVSPASRSGACSGAAMIGQLEWKLPERALLASLEQSTLHLVAADSIRGLICNATTASVVFAAS